MLNNFEQATKIFTDSEVGKELEKNLIEKGGRILG